MIRAFLLSESMIRSFLPYLHFPATCICWKVTSPYLHLSIPFEADWHPTHATGCVRGWCEVFTVWYLPPLPSAFIAHWQSPYLPTICGRLTSYPHVSGSRSLHANYVRWWICFSLNLGFCICLPLPPALWADWHPSHAGGSRSLHANYAR